MSMSLFWICFYILLCSPLIVIILLMWWGWWAWLGMVSWSRTHGKQAPTVTAILWPPSFPPLLSCYTTSATAATAVAKHTVHLYTNNSRCTHGVHMWSVSSHVLTICKIWILSWCLRIWLSNQLKSFPSKRSNHLSVINKIVFSLADILLTDAVNPFGQLFWLCVSNLSWHFHVPSLWSCFLLMLLLRRQGCYVMCPAEDIWVIMCCVILVSVVHSVHGNIPQWLVNRGKGIFKNGIINS